MAKSQESGSYSPTMMNRKALHEFAVLEQFEAGIVLTGTEIKSVRESKVQFADAYCIFMEDGLYVMEMHISPYEFGNINNAEPRRPRKLLLSKKELNKLRTKSDEKGLTMIPIKLYFNDRNFAKLLIALAKGKKLYDKRNDIKEKDTKRITDREMAD